MPPFERHVFVCINERTVDHPRGCCSAKQSTALREMFKAKIEHAGLASKVRINKSGCLDQCEHGPTIVVYPDEVWYGFVREQDVDEIVQSHLVGGNPVERLRLADECINTKRCIHRGGAIQLGGL